MVLLTFRRSTSAVETFAMTRCAGERDTVCRPVRSLSSISSCMLFSTSVIPQIGHAPGSADFTDSCIGQVYDSPLPSADPAVFAGSLFFTRTIWHTGHEPGSPERTEGCMGQV